MGLPKKLVHRSEASGSECIVRRRDFCGGGLRADLLLGRDIVLLPLDGE